jgi:hypothetical protein
MDPQMRRAGKPLSQVFEQGFKVLRHPAQEAHHEICGVAPVGLRGKQFGTVQQVVKLKNQFSGGVGITVERKRFRENAHVAFAAVALEADFAGVKSKRKTKAQRKALDPHLNPFEPNFFVSHARAPAVSSFRQTRSTIRLASPIDGLVSGSRPTEATACSRYACVRSAFSHPGSPRGT